MNAGDRGRAHMIEAPDRQRSELDSELEQQLVRRVRARVAEALASGTGARPSSDGLDTLDEAASGWDSPRTRETGWALIDQVLNDEAQAALRQGEPVLGANDEARVARAVFNSLFALGGFTQLLDDPAVENIEANGADEVWVRYADGTRTRTGPVASSDAELVEMIRTIAARSGEEERRFDRGHPELSISLPDGARLSALMAVCPRPCVTIRRHRFPRTDLDQLRRLGMIDAGLREFLAACVVARKNILVAGGVNLGKTTMLRGLASAIGPQERQITIEDAYELGLERDREAHPNVIPLQARQPNIEGEGEITQSDLVRWALRMNADRVIVGELRGPELVPMCNVMSQGGDGSMASIHASHSQAVFAKLAAYAVQGPERLPLEATNLLVASAVHFVVQLSWADGMRVVSSIREVVQADGPLIVSNEVFRPDLTGRAVPGSPLRPDTLDQLVEVGYDHRLLGHSEGWWDR